MFNSLLGLVMCLHKVSPVKVAVLKDLGRFTWSEGSEILSKGSEASLPYWLAKVLSEGKYVDIREPTTTYQDVAKALVTEKSLKESEFSQLRSKFFVEVKDLFKLLKKESISNPDTAITLVKLESVSDDLIQLRLRKLLRLVLLSRNNIDDYLDKVLPEERVLLMILHTLVSTWRKEVLSDE